MKPNHMSPSKYLTNPIAFHRIFIDVSGNIAGALFLSQLLYWSPRGDDVDGWIYKTFEDWKSEIGINRYELDQARGALIKKGILEEKRKGVPGKIHYRLNMQVLDNELERVVNEHNAEGEQCTMPKSTMHNAEISNAQCRNQQSISTETTTKSTSESTTENTLPLVLSSETKSNPKKTPPNSEIPPSLDTSEFRKSWEDWKQYRKERRKPLGSVAIARQLNQLSAWGVENAIASIDISIQRDWAGLFEPVPQANRVAPGQRPIPLFAQQKALEDRILIHPANARGRRYKVDHTPQQRMELLDLIRQKNAIVVQMTPS